MYDEVGVSCQHCREMGLCAVVEDVTWDAVCFGVCQFISDAEGRTGALSDEDVAFAQPCSVLVVDLYVPFALLHQVKVRASDMLCEYDTCLLYMLDHSSVKVRVNASAPYGACEVYFFHINEL